MGTAKFARADGDFGSQYPAKLEKYALSALIRTIYAIARDIRPRAGGCHHIRPTLGLIMPLLLLLLLRWPLWGAVAGLPQRRIRRHDFF